MMKHTNDFFSCSISVFSTSLGKKLRRASSMQHQCQTSVKSKSNFTFPRYIGTQKYISGLQIVFELKNLQGWCQFVCQWALCLARTRTDGIKVQRHRVTQRHSYYCERSCAQEIRKKKHICSASNSLLPQRQIIPQNWMSNAATGILCFIREVADRHKNCCDISNLTKSFFFFSITTTYHIIYIQYASLRDFFFHLQRLTTRTTGHIYFWWYATVTFYVDQWFAISEQLLRLSRTANNSMVV